MKDKTKSTILLFLICLLLIPSFIFGASSRRTAELQAAAGQKKLSKIMVSPRDLTLPAHADEAALRKKIVVKAYYKGDKVPQIIIDYKTAFNSLNKKEGTKKVTITYTENNCTKKTYVCVTWTKPEFSKPTAPAAKPPQASGEEEDINFPYISGYPDKTFRPNQAVTREELATMLARLITKNQIPTEKNVYKDVNEGRFSTDAINYITKLGIMKPASKDTFDPSGTVTDDEFRQIIKRADPYIKNKDTALLKGNDALTRAEAVVALNKLFNVQCNTAYTSSPFTDVQTTDKDYADIVCATQSRIQPRTQ